MKWKRAFIVLLCANLLILIIAVAWLTSLPKSASYHAPVPISSKASTAAIHIGIGQDAINTYLQYALTQEQDVQRFLASATVQFSNTWDFDAGIKLMDRVVPFELQFTPIVNNGNVDLRVVNASIGDLPVPPSLLFLVLRRVAWPSWIQLNVPEKIIDVNFTARPQTPYGIRIASYNSVTQMLNLIVTIIPKDVLPHK